MKRLLGSFRLGLVFAVGSLAVLSACPSTEEDDPGEDGGSVGDAGEDGSAGNKTSQNSGGKGGASKNSGGSNKGGTTNAGGSNKGGSDDGNKGGTKDAGGGGSTNTAGSGKGGSNAGGSNTAGTNAGGNAAGAGGKEEVTCSNTDMTTLPVDENGWVDKTCNECGIQGAFYWYADDNTKKNLKCAGGTCGDKKPPYQASAKGMCISGTATGSADDWGAGIGLSLNDSGGDNSVKGSFDATKAPCGNITGFDVTLSGNTKGMPVRVGFSTSADGKTISPFIPAGDPAGKTLSLSGSSEIVIKNATIPADWKSTDPSPPDPSKIYDLQFQVATDSASAGDAFELCVTSVKPVFSGDGGGGGGTECKGSKVGTISGNLDLSPLGSNYSYQNNINNLGSGSQSVDGYSGSGCVGMTVNTSGITSSNNAPASYPSIVSGWHWGKWGQGPYNQSTVKTISALSSAKSNLSFKSPTGSKWNVSYDMWVASSTGISQPDGNTLEVMVWLNYSNGETTNPIGDKVGTATMAGTSWEVWYGATGSWHTVTYRRTPSSAAVSNFDLAPFLKDAVTRGTGSGSWTLLSVQAGFEMFKATGGGSIDSYSLTIN